MIISGLVALLMLAYVITGVQYTRNWYSRELTHFHANKENVLEKRKEELIAKRNNISHVSYCNTQYKYLSDIGCDCHVKRKYNQLDREIARLEAGKIDPPELDKKMVFTYPAFVFDSYLKAKAMALEAYQPQPLERVRGALEPPYGYENHPIFKDPLSKQIHETWDQLMKMAEAETKHTKTTADPAKAVNLPKVQPEELEVHEVVNANGEICAVVTVPNADYVHLGRNDVADPTQTEAEKQSRLPDETKRRIAYLKEKGYTFEVESNGNIIMATDKFQEAVDGYEAWKRQRTRIKPR